MNKNKQSQWKKLIAQWERSGQTRSEFCEKRGLSLHQFTYWRTELGKAQQPDGRFVQISGNGSAEPLEIRLSNGTTIKIPSRFDQAALKNVLQVLQ
ncbi:MAG TPA: hypothetical protein PLP17_00715 [Oligoflexia bacterium]|nr:hypothetical protein [Oligoflexia bacterium]